MRKSLITAIVIIFVSVDLVDAIPIPDIISELQIRKGSFTPLDYDADSTHSYDALHLAVELIPDLEEMSFTAQVTMTVEIMEDGLETLPMDHIMLTIDSVKVDDENVDFSTDATSLSITLPEDVEAEDMLSIIVAYHGTIRPDNNFGGLMYNENSDVLYSFGEPYHTRAWIPCYDKPFDKVTSEIIVIMNSSYHVLSNGALSEVEEIDDDLTRTVWSNEDPISTYLISICAHPYVIIDAGTAGVNDTELHYWVYPQDSARAIVSLSRTPEMLEFFESIFGPYPFNKYDQAEAAIMANMEHQTATTLTEVVVRRGVTYELIVAHELAHQWWGDMVGPLTFKEIWLNEGFASYSHMLWYESNNEALFPFAMEQLAQAYYREDNVRRYPLWDPPMEYLFGTAVYYKGAWVLHMLRYMVGDEIFFEGLRQYGETYAYGSATTPEFIEVMEDVSGMDLEDFFEQWIYEAGYPVYNFTNFLVDGDEENGYSVQLDLEQSQVRAPIFTIPLPFLFEDGVRDTLVRVPVADEAWQTLIVENLEFEPTSFVFDPDNWILGVFNDNTSVGEYRRMDQMSFSLLPAYPNPFNSTTMIRYSLPYSTYVSLCLYDLPGRRVATLFNGNMHPGIHSTLLTANDLPSGMYFVRLETSGEVLMRKVMLIR